MTGPIMRFLGHRVFHLAVQQHTTAGQALDLRFGMKLLRDRRVPVASKALAIGIGAAATGLLVSLELPIEALLGMMLPVLGFVADGTLDGLEAVAGPLVIGALVLPLIAPAGTVDALRREHLGLHPATSPAPHRR